MQKNLPYLAVLIVLLYALYNANFKVEKTEKKHKNMNYVKHIQEHNVTHYSDELKKIETTEYLKEYIIEVINHGSVSLHFKPQEIMEGGFASKEDASKIACYVLTLSGKRCKESYPKDAAMFYSSICAGCHGEDGKGLHGTYPDLTKHKLLGIQKREAFLKKMLK